MEKIIYIHGLNCSSKIFNYIHDNLPEHDAQFINYNSQLSVEESFSTALEEVPINTPFWVVGHSLGGIIGYLLALRTTPRIKVRGLISISTPFGGSAAAGTLRWFFHNMPVLRDLSPGSKIIKEVTTNRVRKPFLSIISISGSLPFIGGENDGVVSVESQRASLAKHKIDVYANHFEAVQDPQTIKSIQNFIFGEAR